jgi:hypothetical protein
MIKICAEIESQNAFNASQFYKFEQQIWTLEKEVADKRQIID